MLSEFQLQFQIQITKSYTKHVKFGKYHFVYIKEDKKQSYFSYFAISIGLELCPVTFSTNSNISKAKIHSNTFFQIFWTALAVAFEKKNGTKIPKCIQFLLKKAGYSNSHSFKNLDGNNVDFIESFLDENKQILKQLKGRHSQTYKSMNVFKFLPGHRNVILSILEVLPEVEAAMQRAHSKADAKMVNQCLKRKKKESGVALKQQLLQGLKNVALKLKFDMFADILTDDNLVDFVEILKACDCGKGCNTILKCCFVCPVCPKRYIIQYKRFWMSSNATKHIKKHICEEQAQEASTQNTA